MNTAIIVAAGSGERFGSEIPKQFIEINGKPVIVHTIERFQDAPSIDSIVLVVAENYIPQCEAVVAVYPKLAKIVAGGRTRAESVRNGLRAVDPECDLVAVHDGARPFVTIDEIERTVGKAKETGAACLVAAVTDTIKSVRGGEIADTLDRDKLRRALTPQVFRKDVLTRAFENADLTGTVTDECYLVEKLRYSISFVEGSSRNIKITHPDDLTFAEALLSNEDWLIANS
ncbi:MAG: 2-C-methyl-D-erythritol 4-phosphate cytidylyltransferase [Acidobacteria bacterium]|nr:2-C-methyl-D-erythritol 4-phosphate cytidylyltransferase [Acidobacteriota bacterium]